MSERRDGRPRRRARHRNHTTTATAPANRGVGSTMGSARTERSICVAPRIRSSKSDAPIPAGIASSPRSGSRSLDSLARW